MTSEQKEKIDGMTRFELARMWRFAKDPEPLLSGETGKYFVKVFKEKGWFSPEISKKLGWKKGMYI